jgi:hypothetical protein
LSLYFARMKNIKKSKIFWTNIVGILLILLALLNAETLALLGIKDAAKFATIIGLISATLSAILRTFFHTPSIDPYVKIGGRPRRDKKPTATIPSGFEFKGNDFTETSEVTYSIAPSEEETPVTIIALTNYTNRQEVIFEENIEFTNIEDLTFYIY